MVLITGRNMIDSLLIIMGLSTVLYLATAVFFQVMGQTDHTPVNRVEEKAYKLCILVSYDSSRPAPLVIDMNGARIWPYRL